MGCITSARPVEATIPEQPTGQLDQPQVVADFIVVLDQDPPALRQPCKGPLHHPPTRLVTLRAVTLLGLLADPPDEGYITLSGRRLATPGVVIPLVEVQVLLHLLRVGSLDDDRLDRPFQELLFDDVGPGVHHTQRAPLALGQQALLGP